MEGENLSGAEQNLGLYLSTLQGDDGDVTVKEYVMRTVQLPLFGLWQQPETMPSVICDVLQT